MPRLTVVSQNLIATRRPAASGTSKSGTVYFRSNGYGVSVESPSLAIGKNRGSFLQEGSHALFGILGS
jgi:hypothetical protein